MMTADEKAERRKMRRVYVLNLSSGESFMVAKSSRSVPPRGAEWRSQPQSWVWAKAKRARTWHLTRLKSAMLAMDLCLGCKTAAEAVERLIAAEPQTRNS